MKCTSPFRIAFVSYDFPEYCIRHANTMAESHEVMLALPEGTTREYASLIDPRVRFEPFTKPRLRQPFSQVRTALGLVSKIRNFAPDVVHFQNGHMYFNLAMPLIKKFPLVITIHDARQHLGDSESGQTPQRIMDFGFRQADQVIVHGRSMVETVVNELGFDESQVHIIPHVAIGNTTSPVPIVDERESILFFGRIWEYKGLEFFVRAQPEVSAAFPNARFVIAGRGEDFGRYQKLMANPAAFEIHNDWISDEARTQMFATASMVVLPYIEASQSGVIPIAYTFEKPVVATFIGGLPDMVDDGVTGLLVPPRDASSLAQAIIRLLSDKQHRMQMGRAGKLKLESECAPEVVVEKTLDVYRQAIENGKTKRNRSNELKREMVEI